MRPCTTTVERAGRSRRAAPPGKRCSSIAARFWRVLAQAACSVGTAGGARAEDPDPSASLYPKRNEAFSLDREVTPEKYNLGYNNFYEFSTSKRLDASALKTRPSTCRLDGMVEKEQTVDIDTLIRTIGLEKSVFIATAASKRGRWRSRGPASRCASSSISRVRCPRPNTCSSRPSSTRWARAAVLHALALHRGPDDGGSGQRPRFSSRPALTGSRSPRFRAPRSA